MVAAVLSQPGWRTIKIKQRSDEECHSNLMTLQNSSSYNDGDADDDDDGVVDGAGADDDGVVMATGNVMNKSARFVMTGWIIT